MTSKTHTSASADVAPPPRAFAQGVGVLLQGVGVIMAMTNCCLCSMAGLWDPNLTSHEARQVLVDNPEVVADPGSYLRDPVRAAAAVTILAATVGGLGLAALGLGMQADRPRSAYGAFAANLLLASIFVIAGIALWSFDSGMIFRGWHGLLTVMTLLVVPFTFVAMRQIMRHPPPPVDDTLPPGFDIRDVMAGEKPSRLKVAELRARLEIDQRELERLERELHDPRSAGESSPDAGKPL